MASLKPARPSKKEEVKAMVLREDGKEGGTGGGGLDAESTEGRFPGERRKREEKEEREEES